MKYTLKGLGSEEDSRRIHRKAVVVSLLQRRLGEVKGVQKEPTNPLLQGCTGLR